MELGRYPEAVEDLDQAARLDPQHSGVEQARDWLLRQNVVQGSPRGQNGFGDSKQFRGIATRYCKLDQMYEGLLVQWFPGTKATRRKPSKHLRIAELKEVGQLAFVV